MGVKIILLLLLLGPWVWSKMMQRGCTRFAVAARERNVQRAVSEVEDSMRRRRRASVVQAVQSRMQVIQSQATRISWLTIFQLSFGLLFLVRTGTSPLRC